MSTRATADKSEIDDLYKSAIENQSRSKSERHQTHYTHLLPLDLPNSHLDK